MTSQVGPLYRLVTVAFKRVLIIDHTETLLVKYSMCHKGIHIPVAWVAPNKIEERDSCKDQEDVCERFLQVNNLMIYIDSDSFICFLHISIANKTNILKTQSRERETSTKTELSLAWKPPKYLYLTSISQQIFNINLTLLM